MPEWLQACGTHTYPCQVPGKAGHKTYKKGLTTCSQPVPVCTPGEQISGGCHCYCALYTSETSGAQKHLLFVDFSSAFNSIRPNTLLLKLSNLRLNNVLCNWILDFLTNRSQCVKTGEHISNTIYINTGTPQRCVLSPLLYTHECSASFPTNHIVKSADDATVLGLITNNNEMAYREETELLAGWCKEHNLALNIKKTFVNHPRHSPLYINGEAVERVNGFKFLTVSEDLSWGNNITLAVGKPSSVSFSSGSFKKTICPRNSCSTFTSVQFTVSWPMGC